MSIRIRRIAGPVRAALATAALALVLALSATPAAADYSNVKELVLEPGQLFEIDTDAGRITLRGGSESGARIEITSQRDDVEERFDMSFEETADGVRVSVEKRGSLSGWFSRNGNSLHFDITVPRNTELDLRTSGGSITVSDIDGETRLRTSGGRIELEEIGGPVDAHTSGGSISARSLGDTAKLDTSGGKITVDGVAGDLFAETSGGSIHVEGARGAIDASTSGGSVSATFTAGNNSGGSLSTSGGSVVAYVDPAAKLDIDASTSGGSVTVDVPVTVQGKISKRSISGSLNGGGAKLRLRSSGGSIRVKSL